MSLETYKPGSYPNLPPPLGTVGVSGWVRNNLFSSISNSILTIFLHMVTHFRHAVASAGGHVDRVPGASTN